MTGVTEGERNGAGHEQVLTFVREEVEAGIAAGTVEVSALVDQLARRTLARQYRQQELAPRCVDREAHCSRLHRVGTDISIEVGWNGLALWRARCAACDRKVQVLEQARENRLRELVPAGASGDDEGNDDSLLGQDLQVRRVERRVPALSEDEQVVGGTNAQ